MKVKNLIKSVAYSACLMMGVNAYAAHNNPLLHGSANSSRYLLCRLQQCANHTVMTSPMPSATYETCILHPSTTQHPGDCQKFFKTMTACAKAHAKGNDKTMTVNDLQDKKMLSYIGGARSVSDLYDSGCNTKRYLKKQKENKALESFLKNYNKH